MTSCFATSPAPTFCGNDLVHPEHLFPLYSQISTLHKPWPVEKDIDVLFLGNLNHAAHADRARYLERLAKLSDRYRVVIAGGIVGEAYGQLLARARIVFNHSIRGELNLRVFETLACGSLAFIEDTNEEVRDWFKPGHEIVLYNADDFEERVRYYLDNPSEAARIAANGHARAGEFAGENRYDGIIDWAAGRVGSGRPFLHLAPSERAYQDLLMYGFTGRRVYQPVETRLVTELMQARPYDPRVWTAAGQHIANAYSRAGDPEARRERYTKAFLRARGLDDSSMAYAFNLATVFRMEGDSRREEAFLADALGSTGFAGADWLLGAQTDPFWVRWQIALARNQATASLLHGEVHIRLAALCAREGRLDAARDHLDAAAELDPANTGGIRLRAEIAWSTGRREEAVQILSAGLVRLPFDMDARERLLTMLTELGWREEVRTLAEESLRIARACPDTTALRLG